ncbi:hypothetical protein [Erythrobacter ani]|uniref:Uncharacterized protein n=1 Tax=Erythrobacter ani TaxID=2827235 RepID=A0ABS6SJJ9_9SPHN|nr:hypothetical protein [Erythrobacter ani]MBV7265137.1 hypothetical protein [Erythrobacter ani]
MRLISGSLLVASSLLAVSQAQAQQCVVPHTLVNGQVADATEVMDNFNAVAACVENTTTHEGTPNAGEIAVFDSATGITGGNLTGDVTTSGSTATTLTDTGVVPGSYASPNIIVDSKGRITSATNSSGGGGGGGGSFYEAPPRDIPSLANFTWLNQGSSVAADTGNGLVMTADVDGEIHGLMQAAPTSSTYDVFMRVDQTAGYTNISTSYYSYPLILLRNSQSGRLLNVYLGHYRSSRDRTWVTGIRRWATPTSYSAEGVPARYLAGNTRWVRVNVSGDTVTLFVSPNGYHWIEIGAESISAFLTASGGSLDEIGFGLMAGSASFSTAVFQQFGTNPP